MLGRDVITHALTTYFRHCYFVYLIVQVVEQPQAPVYKSNSSSWATVREGEPEPTRESVLKRNIVPEWDDVDNEDERPSIAGIGKVCTCLNSALAITCNVIADRQLTVIDPYCTSCGNGVQCTFEEPSKDTKEHKIIRIEIQINRSRQHRAFTITTSEKITLA